MSPSVVEMIEDCERASDKLSGWEAQFVDSLSNQPDDKPFSAKQVSKLRSIWENL